MNSTGSLIGGDGLSSFASGGAALSWLVVDDASSTVDSVFFGPTFLSSIDRKRVK